MPIDRAATYPYDQPAKSSWLFRFTLYGYVAVSCIIGPLLIPFRVFDIFNTAYVVYANVGFVLLFALSARSPMVFLPDSFFAYLLLTCMVFGALIGLSNFEFESDLPVAERNYLSHAFQLTSAYVMFSIGRSQHGDLWSEPVMRLLMLMTIGADVLSSIIIFGFGIQYGLGGYLVGLGASFAALCYFLPRNRGIALVTMLVLLVSGKRGPMVAGLIVFALSWALPSLRHRVSGISLSTLAALAVAVVTMGTVATIVRPDTVDQVIESIEDRVTSIPTAFFSRSDEERRIAAGGRYDEVDAIIEGFTTTDWLVGRGFGYQILAISDEEATELHQVHFTPATLATRFGLPITVVFYSTILMIVGPAIWARLWNRSPTFAWSAQRETILLYLVGGLLISLTSFTIFIDLSFMLYLGVLSRAPRQEQRIRTATLPRADGWPDKAPAE